MEQFRQFLDNFSRIRIGSCFFEELLADMLLFDKNKVKAADPSLEGRLPNMAAGQVFAALPRVLASRRLSLADLDDYANRLCVGDLWRTHESAAVFVVARALQFGRLEKHSWAYKLFCAWLSSCQHQHRKDRFLEKRGCIGRHQFACALLVRQITQDLPIGSLGKPNDSEDWGVAEPSISQFLVPVSARTPSWLAREVTAQEESAALDLLRQLRVVQWEIMNKDLRDEQEVNVTRYIPFSSKFGGAWLGDKEFARFVAACWQSNWILAAVRSGATSSVLEGQCKRGLPDGLSETSVGLKGGFEKLLPLAFSNAPRAYEELTQCFTDRDDAGHESHTKLVPSPLIVQDGELTFFSLLWVLRYMRSRDITLQGLSDWGEESRQRKRFLPAQLSISSDSPRFTKTSVGAFLAHMGLFGKAAESGLSCATKRWASLVHWLARMHDHAVRDDTGKADWLPVKKAGWDNCPIEVGGLRSLFSSDVLAEYLRNADSRELTTTHEFVKNKFMPLVKLIWDQTSVMQIRKDFDSINDYLINHLVRVAWLPIEYALRVGSPEPFTLLIFPLGGARTNKAPRSLGFITCLESIYDNPTGAVGAPTGLDECHSSFQAFLSQVYMWVASEHIEKRAEELGEFKTTKLFAHSAINLVNLILNDKETLRPHFQFALWKHRELLALIYGGIEPDPAVRVTDPDSGFFRRYSMLGFLRLMTRTAVLTGVERALLPPSRSRPDPEKKVIEPLVNAYIKPRYSAEVGSVNERIRNLEHDLGFKMSRLGEKTQLAWLDYKAFAICYYEVLWQAAYHGLLACAYDKSTGAKARKPYLNVRLGDLKRNTLTVSNRLMKLEGEQKKEILRTFDRKFISQVSESFKGIIEVEAPEISGDQVVFRLVIHDVPS